MNTRVKSSISLLFDLRLSECLICSLELIKFHPGLYIVGRSNICDSSGKSSLQETNLESEIDNDLSETRPSSTFYDK